VHCFGFRCYRSFALATGWSLSAAEAVGAGPLPVVPGQVAQLLTALVDKSLVQAEDYATRTRYRLQEVIRAFAHEQLAASGEMDDVRARYGICFAGLSRDQYLAAFALLMAGMAALLMADTALARTRAAERVELFTEISDRWGAGYARCVLADCLIRDGTPR
jgi:predicted ATPase